MYFWFLFYIILVWNYKKQSINFGGDLQSLIDYLVTLNLRNEHLFVEHLHPWGLLDFIDFQIRGRIVVSKVTLIFRHEWFGTILQSDVTWRLNQVSICVSLQLNDKSVKWSSNELMLYACELFT